MKHCPLCTLVLASVLLLPALALGQSGGPNLFGYEYDSTAFEYVAVPTSATPGPSFDDDELTVTLPWAFEWYGVSYPAVTIGDNGGVSFTLFDIDYSNECLPPTLFATPPEIGIFWDDLNVSLGSGSIWAWHDTTSGNDRFIISWENVAAF
ncbi:MAG: hypothetical protein VX498_03370, partial [Myxococcota bacterium]|nr:hypothetical protein [Myxococcota bacterium]